jgi:hypothetical protein
LYHAFLDSNSDVQQLPLTRRFEPTGLETLLNRPPNDFDTLDGYDLHAITSRALHALYSNEHNAARNYHAIVLLRNGRNDDLEAFAKQFMIDNNLTNSERPVVFQLAYGRNQLHKHGSALICNPAAARMFRAHIFDIDRSKFITKFEYRDATENRKKKLKTFEEVIDPIDPTRKVILVNKRIQPDNTPILDMGRGIVKIGLPSTGVYRIRTQLTLTHEVMKRANCNHVFSVTLGDRLLKEGIVVKTWDHDLPADSLICAYSCKNFMTRAVDELLQALGRLCGIRMGEHGRCPSLYLTDRNAYFFKKIINLDEGLVSTIMQSPSRRYSVEDIIQLGLSMSDQIQVPHKLTKCMQTRLNDLIDLNDDSATNYADSILQLRTYLKNQSMALRRAITGVLLNTLHDFTEDEDEDENGVNWTCSVTANDLRSDVVGPVISDRYSPRQVLDIFRSVAQSGEHPWIMFSNEDSNDIGRPPAEVLIVIRDEQDEEEEEEEGEEKRLQPSILASKAVANAFMFCKCHGFHPARPRDVGVECYHCKWGMHKLCHIDEIEIDSFDADSYMCGACKTELGTQGLPGAADLFAGFW